ncbi:MAG TPA: methylmalonyl Co-A mutase-associated GTPase MeaB [Chloroflexota bacterium]|nr:methylmalonyl Co-A mutase-associated GTPase MeaB [Chloroflexota bacterium]
MIIERLDEAVLSGHPRAVARAITMVETGGEDAEQLMEKLRQVPRHGHLIGFTGAPGAGKSSLICKLAKEYRARGKSVGVIAVDPTSPFSGGAVLGDRIRMGELSSDPGVFVRSMASRGRPGGLAAAVEDAAVILQAAGKEIILLETVGVGQGELDVASAVQTTVVVLTPGMGDEIQSLKAGILEVADVYVVNKSDLVGADTVARSLQSAAAQQDSSWVRPVLLASSVTSVGVPELADAIDCHKEYLEGNRVPCEQEIRLTYQSILSIAGRQLISQLQSKVDRKRLERLATEVASGEMDPREAAEEAVSLFLAAQFGAMPRQEKREAVAAGHNGRN